MSLEHPYKNIYLDQQFYRRPAKRRRSQGYRVPHAETWTVRLISAALLLAAACSLLLAVLLAGGLVWLIAQVVQEIGRWWR